MKCLKSFLLAIFLSIFIISSISYARGKTPSIFDRPEEGLYYILIINLSSMPLEVQIKFVISTFNQLLSKRLIRHSYLQFFSFILKNFYLHKLLYE